MLPPSAWALTAPQASRAAPAIIERVKVVIGIPLSCSRPQAAHEPTSAKTLKKRLNGVSPRDGVARRPQDGPPAERHRHHIGDEAEQKWRSAKERRGRLSAWSRRTSCRRLPA